MSALAEKRMRQRLSLTAAEVERHAAEHGTLSGVARALGVVHVSTLWRHFRSREELRAAFERGREVCTSPAGYACASPALHREAVLLALLMRTGAARPEIAGEAGMSFAEVNAALLDLVRLGLVDECRAGACFVYSLTPAGREEARKCGGRER